MVGINTKVGEKGQLVIPKPIREQFNIHKDTEVVFDVEDEKITIKKKRKSLEVFEDFVNAVKKKREFKHIDWDTEYYSQLD